MHCSQLLQAVSVNNLLADEQNCMMVLRNIPGLLEPITAENPEVMAAVSRAVAFASVQPTFLEPEEYVDALETALRNLEYENRNIVPSKRR